MSCKCTLLGGGSASGPGTSDQSLRLINAIHASAVEAERSRPAAGPRRRDARAGHGIGASGRRCRNPGPSRAAIAGQVAVPLDVPLAQLLRPVPPAHRYAGLPLLKLLYVVR